MWNVRKGQGCNSYARAVLPGFVFVLAITFLAPVAGAIRGGKMVFDETHDSHITRVYTMFSKSFFYLQFKGVTRAWTGDNADRRSHFSFILSPSAEKTLVIEPGAGAPVAAAYLHGAMSVDVVTENRAIVKAAGVVNESYGKAMSRSSTKIINENALVWLDKAQGEYDVILAWASVFKPEEMTGVFSTEIMDKLARLIKPGGTATLWVPLGMYEPEVFDMILGEFANAFPNYTIWMTETNPDLGWAVFIGSKSRMNIDLSQVYGRLEKIKDYYRMEEGVNAISLVTSFVSDKEGMAGKLPEVTAPAGEDSPLKKLVTPTQQRVKIASMENFKKLAGLRTEVAPLTNADEQQKAMLEKYFRARGLMLEGRSKRGGQEGRFEQALYQQAMELVPDDPILASYFYSLGKIYFFADMLPQAAHFLESAKSIAPDHAGTRYYLGKSYEAMRRYEKATPEFKKLQELEPNYRESFMGSDF